MKYFYSIFILFVSLSTLKAQSVSGTKHAADTTAINYLMKIADNALNPDSAIILYDEVFQLSAAANYADGAFRALMIKGIKYYEQEDYAGERDCSIQALPWAKKATAKDATAWCYNNIGDSYIWEGDYIKASENCYRSLDELKKAGVTPTHTTVNVYNNLGLINIRLGQPAKGMAYFKEAESIARKWKLDFQLGNALTNMGEYYTSIHQTDSAIRCFNEIMQVGKRTGKPDLVAQANEEMGKAFTDAGAYQKAIPLLQLAISTAQSRFSYIAMDASYSLGDVFYRTGKYKEAENILLSALKETKAHNYKDNYINCYSKLADVYSATGNYKKALECTDSLIAIKNALSGAEKAKAINQMEIRYKTAEKDKQLALSQLLIAEQNNKIVHKNIWLSAIAGSVFLLSVLLISVYVNSRHKQRLQAAQIRSLQHENTISILKGVVQGEEQERGRIARELHDGIGGMLSAIMMRLASIRHGNDDINKAPAYTEAMKLLNEMGNEIRITAHNLMPEVLLKQSLPDAVRIYCNHIREQSSLDLDFQSYGSFDEIAIDTKLNIYRIVQELLKNVTQHADATHALVQLLIDEHLLTITVEDNGKGYNTNAATKGIGLHNLQTRVHSMYGNITTESGTEKGTSVYIEFDRLKMTTGE